MPANTGRTVTIFNRNQTELMKRALGISAAILFLVARDIAGKRRYFQSHPPTYERLLNVLSGIEMDDDSLVYGGTFVILDILLTAAGKTSSLDRDKASLRDLCFEACMVLREEDVVAP